MKTLFSGGDFFEGPRWHAGSWWVSDMFGPNVWRIGPDGHGEIVAVVEPWPSGLGWLPGGDLLIVAMRARRLLRLGTGGRLTIHAELASCSPWWNNDMFVDRHGRAYVGNLGFDPSAGGDPGPTTMCRIDPDGSGTIVASDLLFPNGTVATADGRTLIVGETMGNRMTAFTIAEDGSLRDRRVWAQFGPPPAPADYSLARLHDLDLAPDGCAIDRDDCIWVADAANNRVCHVAEGGRILREIAAPAGQGFHACALGGEDGRSLLICAAPSNDPAELAGKGRAILFVEQVDVPAPLTPA